MVSKAVRCSEGPLIKFQTADRIKDLRNGKMYMRSLQWYREYAANNPAIGDEYEALLHINEATVYISAVDTNEIISIQKFNNDLIKTKHSDDFVFCMFGVENNEKKFEFSDEQKKAMLNFGDTALLITDRDEFIKRVRTALENCCIPLDQTYFGNVNYYDETVDSAGIYCELKKGLYHVAYQKRKGYAYQQEYRILLPNTAQLQDHYILDIGSIEDISEVFEASRLLNSYAIREVNHNGQA